MMSSRRSSRYLLLASSALLVAACADSPDGGQLPTDSDRGIERVGSDAGDFGTALAVHSRVTPELMEIPGVVGTGLAMDETGPRMLVYAESPRVRVGVRDVEHIPVQRVVTGRFYAGDVNNPTSKQRPTPNGFSVGHPAITAGTLGAIVRGTGNVCYALSNNHVLANSNNASIGDLALQPGPFDGGSAGDAIGTLADFEPIKFRGWNRIDAAIAELYDASLVTATTPAYAYGAPGTSPTSASVGLQVQKFGRTTGHTTGVVAEVNVTVQVCYNQSCSARARFRDQIAISDGSFSDGGDSGSLIVTNDGGRRPVGLLFAGSATRTIANPIQDALGAFGVVVETNPANCSNGGGGEPPPNQDPEADFSFTTSGLTADFTDASSDDDGTIVNRNWSFGDGGSASATNPSHTFASGGTYQVTLVVTDDDGGTDQVTKPVSVDDGGPPPPAGIELEASGSKNRGRHVVALSWSGASGSHVQVLRDGGLVATTENDGSYTDHTGNRGSATYVYQVCETGGGACSSEVTVAF